MAHPSRARQVDNLLLELEEASPQVAWDEGGDRWSTGRRAMLAHLPFAPWHIVVQDDAVLCRNFLEAAGAALAVAGSGPVSFYMGKGMFGRAPTARMVNAARRMGRSWIRAAGPRWGVAVAVRTSDIGPMLEWCDSHPEPQYDLRMMHYFLSIQRRCAYSVPSLVNHMVGPKHPSLIPGRGSSFGRTATWFLGTAPMEWTPASTELPLSIVR